MVFSSLTFLCVFLPIVLLVHTAVPSRRVQNGFLVVASLLFYAYGEPVYVLLMILNTWMNYLFGRWIGSAEGKNKRGILALAVVLNLGMLGVFKYAGFFCDSLNGILPVQIPVPEIRLPVGISFYTFQAMSYVIDVYRGDVRAQRNYGKILLYISFFPQLIAGPIVKYHDIAEEIDNRKVALPEMAEGTRRFLCGLGKKVLLSNTMATAADALFAVPAAQLNILGAWLGAVAYLFQIYFDFSGYSDMAIGMGKMFGFHFKENFHYPYSAVNIQDFWRRWHISLSSWFKEYLYIPLGGNRKGRLRTSVNRLIVFFCTGLWHGASWTFVFWGLYHGFFLILEGYLPVRKMNRVLGHVYAIVVVCVGFVIFRADSLTQGFVIVGRMFTGFSFDALSMSVFVEQLTPLFLLTLAVSLAAALPLWEGVKKRIADPGRARVAEILLSAGSLMVLLLCLFSLSGGTYNPFIYFRF